MTTLTADQIATLKAAPAETVECSCEHCADWAAKTGQTLPLRVAVPALFASGLTRGKRGFGKALTHNLVHMGHSRAAIDVAVRARSGVKAI